MLWNLRYSGLGLRMLCWRILKNCLLVVIFVWVDLILLIGRADWWRWESAVLVPWVVLWRLWVMYSDSSGCFRRSWGTRCSISKSMCDKVPHDDFSRPPLCLAWWKWLGKSQCHQTSHVINLFGGCFFYYIWFAYEFIDVVYTAYFNIMWWK